MSADLTAFTYQADTTVRTVLIDAEPWFVARDVCEVVGISKHRDAIARLDDDERASTAVDTPGGPQQMAIVNEAGVYSLMLISRSPKVRPFKRWLTHEVLPQLRKTGQYGSQVPSTFAEALELAAAQQRQIEATERRALEAEQRIEQDAPKVAAYERLMDADGFYSMEAASKALGFGRNTLFRMLRDDRVLLGEQPSGAAIYAPLQGHHVDVDEPEDGRRTPEQHDPCPAHRARVACRTISAHPHLTSKRPPDVTRRATETPSLERNPDERNAIRRVPSADAPRPGRHAHR